MHNENAQSVYSDIKFESINEIIPQVVVRLSHPAAMELVLRKRLAINVYKRQSLTDKLKKRIGKSVSN